MARNWFIQGESMVAVKGNVNTSISSLTNLGLAVDNVTITPSFQHEDMMVDAYGGGAVPADVQMFLSSVVVNMTLVHFDAAVLDVCMSEAMAGGNGTNTAGIMPRTGTTMGGNAARFAAGNHYIGLNISGPVSSKPYRFYFAYLANNPVSFPLGTHKSAVALTWRCIPYTQDPWNGGLGSYGQVLWDNTLDS